MLNPTPETIIRDLDALPEVDQREVFDAIVPSVYGSRLAALHRMPDLGSDLRTDARNEASTEVFTDGGRVCEGVFDHADDAAATRIAVALVDGHPFDADCGDHRIIRAALSLIEEALECRTLDDATAQVLAYVTGSLRDIARRIERTFKYNGKYADSEQVRPWLDVYRMAVERNDGSPYGLEGKIGGMVGSPDEGHGLRLLQSLDEYDRHCDRVAEIANEADSVIWIAPTDQALIGTEWRFDEVIVCVPPGRGRSARDAIMRYPKGKIRWPGVMAGLQVFKQRATVHGDRIPSGATIIVKGSKA